MSCFVVENEIINDSIAFLKSINNNGYDISKPLRQAGYDIESRDGRKRLANDLFKMNIDAYNDRYPDNDENMTLDDFEFEDKSSLYIPIQCCKFLHCLMYQCSEGDVVNNPLYKTMEEVIANLEKFIVTTLDEYNKARWS